MATRPPTTPDPTPSLDAERPDILVVEAGESRERRCAECGQRTTMWRPTRRRGVSVILCTDCAAKAKAGPVEDSDCPGCGAVLQTGDRFCGKCGQRIEYACPSCAAHVEADDAFCARCGTRIG